MPATYEEVEAKIQSIIDAIPLDIKLNIVTGNIASPFKVFVSKRIIPLNYATLT